MIVPRREGCGGALRGTALGVAVLLWGACLVGPASAQEDDDVPRRRVGIQWIDGAPAVSFSVKDLANAGVRRKLESGLPQTLTLRVLTYRDDAEDPVATTLRVCRVTYDLWEEVFRVQYGEGTQRQTRTMSSIDDVLDGCLVARGLRAASPGAVALRDRIYFAVLVELNPMSEETVRRIRRWLTRPSEGQGEAFFGSFVSLFVSRRLGRAEREIRFRSQWVEVP